MCMTTWTSLQWEYSENKEPPKVGTEKQLEAIKQIYSNRVLVTVIIEIWGTSPQFTQTPVSLTDLWLYRKWVDSGWHPLRNTCARSERLRTSFCPFLTFSDVKQAEETGVVSTAVPQPPFPRFLHIKEGQQKLLDSSFRVPEPQLLPRTVNPQL